MKNQVENQASISLAISKGESLLHLILGMKELPALLVERFKEQVLAYLTFAKPLAEKGKAAELKQIEQRYRDLCTALQRELIDAVKANQVLVQPIFALKRDMYALMPAEDLSAVINEDMSYLIAWNQALTKFAATFIQRQHADKKEEIAGIFDIKIVIAKQLYPIAIAPAALRVSLQPIADVIGVVKQVIVDQYVKSKYPSELIDLMAFCDQLIVNTNKSPLVMPDSLLLPKTILRQNLLRYFDQLKSNKENTSVVEVVASSKLVSVPPVREDDWEDFNCMTLHPLLLNPHLALKISRKTRDALEDQFNELFLDLQHFDVLEPTDGRQSKRAQFRESFLKALSEYNKDEEPFNIVVLNDLHTKMVNVFIETAGYHGGLEHLLKICELKKKCIEQTYQKSNEQMPTSVSLFIAELTKHALVKYELQHATCKAKLSAIMYCFDLLIIAKEPEKTLKDHRSKVSFQQGLLQKHTIGVMTETFIKNRELEKDIASFNSNPNISKSVHKDNQRRIEQAAQGPRDSNILTGLPFTKN